MQCKGRNESPLGICIRVGITAKGRASPICSTIAAAPYLTGDIVYTLGDLTGRRFSKIDDGEIFIGVPFERMGSLINGLEKIAERHHSG